MQIYTLLKEVQSSDTLHTLKNIKIIFLAVFFLKLFLLIINLVKELCFIGGKNAIYRFIEAILKEYDYCKEIIKKYLDKNLIMSAEDEERFQLSNNFWICDKLFHVGDDKVRGNCHITGKYRCSAHWSFKLTKKVPVIFHNLRSYDSHLIMQEICKFDLKVSVIPNGLEK